MNKHEHQDPSHERALSEFELAKKAWHAELQSDLEKSKASGISLSVLIVDINNLKWLNDTVSHQAGDVVIEWVRQILTVIPHAKSARIGGDEFGVTVVGEENIEEIIKYIKDSFLAQVNAASSEAMKEARVGVAIGASSASLESTMSDLTREADNKMYDDKMRQQNFSPDAVADYEQLAQGLEALGHRRRDFARWVIYESRRRNAASAE